MADDVTVDNGTLTDYVVSADAATADGALVQRVKLAYSADGSTTHVAADADGLLVNLGANNDVTVTGTVAVSGTVAVTDNSGSLTVDNAGTFAVQAAQSGTWTVQPGNTANTTAWKVDGSAVTQPISGTVTANAGTGTMAVSLASVPSHAVTNAGTFATQESQILADNAGFTDGTTKVFASGYIFDEVAGTALTENDIAAARIDSKRATVGVIEDATTRGQRAAVSAAGRLSVDASGVAVPVTDNSGSLTVDNAGTFAVQESGSALTALQLIDNLVLAEDLASASADPGVQMLAVRKATPANLSGTDGDYEPLQVSAGRLWASATIDAALPAGTNAIGKLASNSGVTIGAVEIAAAQTLATVTTVGTVTNVVHVDDNSSSLTVDNGGTFAVQATSVVPGTAATSLGKAVDTAAGATDTGVATLFIRDDALSAITPAEGDYAPGRVDANGAQWVSISSGSVTASGTIDVDGTVAHDAADSGDPVKVGHKAANAFPTAVANADRANSISDLFGRQLTAHVDPAMTTWKHFSATSTATGHMIWNPAAGKRIAVTNLQIGTTGSVASDLIVWFGDASDTTYTEGTDQVLFDGTFVPSSSAAPGAVNPFPHPVFCTTADRKLRFSQPSSMQTKITVQGYEW